MTWKDPDAFKRELIINKSVTNSKGERLIQTPKTKTSIRRIAIHQQLMTLLLQWKAIQSAFYANKLAIELNDDSHIFYCGIKYMTRLHVRKFMDEIYRENSTLKRIRIHDFRHSHVALLINQDEQLPIIKERMGHSSITITIDVYGHLFPNKQKEMADKFDNLTII